MAPTPDLSVPVIMDMAVVVPPIHTDDGGLGGDGGFGDGGLGCPSNYSISIMYNSPGAGQTTCNDRSGAAEGAACTTAADCATVCCSCTSGSNKYSGALCDNGHCHSEEACTCAPVATSSMSGGPLLQGVCQ